MHPYHESRKIARERWRKTEHGKKWTQDYMRAYRARPYVKAKYHEYYVKNKMCWGEIKKQKEAKNWGGKREKTIIYKHHEDWARENGYRDNDTLNAENTERIIKDAQK
tara:strand:- start:578 stop:901 length:324 start_codon:yes stop_codon:yes gene_type:complete